MSSTGGQKSQHASGKEGTTVGSYVDALCGKCKEMTSHIVLAKIGASPTRVECRTCHAMHAYRVPGKARTPGAGRAPAAARSRASADPAQVWANSMRDAQGPAVTYSPNRQFAIGTRLAHPSFGEGAVVRHASPTVCEVVFRERTVKLKMGPEAG